MTFVRGLSHPVSLSAIFVPKGNPNANYCHEPEWWLNYPAAGQNPKSLYLDYVVNFHLLTLWA